MGTSSGFTRRIVSHYVKYDKENPFIFISALLAFLGIAAGVMVLMLAMGIMHGMQKEFKKKLFVMNYPLTVLPLQEDALNKTLVHKLQSKFPKLKMSAYYTTQVIAKNDSGVQGGLLYGVDFEDEAAINSVFSKAIGNQTSQFKAIIGEGFSFELGVERSDSFVLYFSEQQAIGFGSMPLQKRFKVDGIFKSGLANYDKAILYTTHEAFHRVLKRDVKSYDGLHIFTPEPMQVIENLRQALPSDVTVEGWWQQNGNFFAAMEMEKKALFLVLLLIILVASLNIISSLLMTVMSRRSEIALMRTLGATKKEIYQIFFRLGLLVGSAGIVVGALLGALGIWVLKTFDFISLPADVYGTTKLPVELLPVDFILILIGTALIVLLSSLYPAKKASQTDPLIVLRNE